MTQQNTDPRGLGDSFAVAILQWPALIAAVTLEGEGWIMILRGVLGTWAALVSLGLIFGRKEGPRWGLVMTLCAAVATAFWMTVPTLWALGWFVGLMVLLHTAIKVRLEEPPVQEAEEPVAS